jgi:hypothetical protein
LPPAGLAAGGLSGFTEQPTGIQDHTVQQHRQYHGPQVFQTLEYDICSIFFKDSQRFASVDAKSVSAAANGASNICNDEIRKIL